MRELPATDWRTVFAALANEEVRAVYAQVVLGVQPLNGQTGRTAARTRRSLGILVRANLIAQENDTCTAVAEVFSAVLASQSVVRKDGVDRFLRHGRIVQFPATPSAREELLRWVAGQVLRAGEIISERQMNERLSALHADVALLRRGLVDLAIVERSRSGSDYWLKQTETRRRRDHG
ncbi:DUF2087 domain-containing protein [Curtobacterium sp. MCLR17_007]|uniref:DUF2087 domain-containing protein n=1 Tax=Curtobacterium sp. MCLR17_007 TaxID=2175648 RepID=UPI000DA9D7C5|nr:DUF2087 domain-containing protein [Curtobacterium sp. MCLR17_007]WIB61104.1 DUF2087 domain-containing protein [Curtobacterium sp. MCLR17_007]